MRLRDTIHPNKLREADQQAHLDREEARRKQNMAALAQRCERVGYSFDAASWQSTVDGMDLESWLLCREADAGLLPPPAPEPRWQPRCIGMLGPGLYALDAAAARQAVIEWTNRTATERGCPISFGEGELASAIGLSGGEFLAVLDGRAPLSEARLVALARELDVSPQSIVWRRPSGLRELP